MKNKNVLASLLLGAAAGAVLGILLAPDKGKETRKKISKKSGEFGDGIKNKFNDVKETIKTKYDNIRQDANTILEKEHEAKRNFS